MLKFKGWVGSWINSTDEGLEMLIGKIENAEIGKMGFIYSHRNSEGIVTEVNISKTV